MKKSFLAIVIILSMLVTMGMSGNAAESRTVTVKPILTFDNTTATCQVSISAARKQISATLELWHESTLVDSWTSTATARLVISETCSVESGKTYTLKVSGTIGGEAFEGVPVSATCN